jgi:uncharacterized protein YpmS
MIGIAFFVLTISITVKADEVYFTNLEGIEMTETEYNNLLNLAFTPDQINRMDYQTYIDNKDLEGEIVGHTKKHYKITATIQNGIQSYTYQEISEFEMLHAQQVQLQNPSYSPNVVGTFYDGYSYDLYRTMESYIVCLYNTIMRYKVDVQWNSIPTERSWDIIGIGIEANKVHLASTVIFREDWLTTSLEADYTDSCGIKDEGTGESAVFQLPSGSLETLEAFMYFNVYKNENVGTLTSIVAVGDYAHATQNVTFTGVYPNYTVNHALGIDFDEPYANIYESSMPATALFVGTW